MNFIFILNGEFDTKYELNFFSNYNKIICIDGGYLNFQKLNLNLKPDYIIGDFDSIGKIDIINQNTDKPKVIFKDNQDETDSEFAVKYILKNYSNNDIKNIDFIYAVSTSRIDHLFCNAYLLKKIPININSKIITNYQDIFLLRNSINIKEKEGKTLSVIPITNVKGLTIKGCKWDLENTDLSVGFIGGISNIIEQNLAEISLKEGECIIVITYVLK